MGPGVAGGAERKVGLAVGVTEIVGIAHGDGAVISRGRRDAEERSGLAIELAAIAVRDVAPFAFGVRREANFVGAASIVEAIDHDAAVLLPELGGELHVEEGIAFSRAGELEFEAAPAFDVARRRLCVEPRGQRCERAGEDSSPRGYQGHTHPKWY